MYKLAKRDRQFIEQWRGVYPAEMRWYAAMTRFGTERAVCRTMLSRFGGNGIAETMLPEVSPRELLFPCYVFIRCRMSDPIYMEWAACDGVVSVLGRAWRIPTALEDREIQHLRAILAGPERPEAIVPCRVGRPVVVTCGILQGLRGRILETSTTHYKIETQFSFLNNMTAITVAVPRDDVRAVDEH